MPKEVVAQTDKEAYLAEFSDLRPDLNLPTDWPDEKKQAVLAEIRPQTIRTGMYSDIPIICKGAKCPYAGVCPLFEKNLHPTGKKCPIELAAVQQFMADYTYELGVDQENRIEMSIVRQLVDQEIQYLRKTKYLAQESFIQDNVVGIDKDGNPIMQKELHKAVELEDKIHKRMKDLRNSLLATREARAKIGHSPVDTSQSISNLMDDVRELERKQEELLRAKLEKLELDDIIEAEIVEEPEEEDGS